MQTTVAPDVQVRFTCSDPLGGFAEQTGHRIQRTWAGPDRGDPSSTRVATATAVRCGLS